MARKITLRVLALAIVAAMVLPLAACQNANSNGNNIVMISLKYDEESPYAPANNSAVTPAPGSNSGDNGSSAAPAPVNDGGASATTPTTAAPAPTKNDGGASTTTPTTAAPEPTKKDSGDTPAPSSEAPSSDAPTEAPAAALPTSPADILARYTEVMNTTKSQVKGFTKKEWQEISDTDFGAASSIADSVLKKNFKGESEVSAEQKTEPKDIPPSSNTVGCGLSDAGAIKSASCQDLGNGQAKITIVLNDEVDAEPMSNDVSPSKSGGIFPCMSRSTLEGQISSLPAIKVNSFQLLYQDCKVEATFDTATNHLSEIHYVMPVHASGNVSLLVSFDIGVTVTDVVHIDGFTY